MTDYAAIDEALAALGGTPEAVEASIRGLKIKIKHTDDYISQNNCYIAQYLRKRGFKDVQVGVDEFWVGEYKMGQNPRVPEAVCQFILKILRGEYRERKENEYLGKVQQHSGSSSSTGMHCSRSGAEHQS